MNGADLITEHLDTWIAARTPKPSGGRGNGNRADGRNCHGIKKLRELILELAVRGKLVPQDPDDEPASELLKKIAEEKERLIKEGKIKQQKPLPEIREDEKPFELPKGWEWVRLGDVTNYGISDKASPEEVDDDMWILELEDVEKETSKLLQKVRYADRQFISTKNFFSKGDVIYGKLRPYLDKVIVSDERGVCTTEMIPLRGYKNISSYFLKLVMKSPYFIRYANESTHGMNLPRLGTDKARLALFPIVSEPEQHRIVAKVDELMALCDQLEQEQADSNQTHQALIETLLANLADASDHEEFLKAWKHITTHFDMLFTTEQSIDQLKQTILQLAVMGKLVPQDPDDEPASVLLEKIAKEKERLIKEGKIKKQKPLPKIREEEKPFELPKGWEWARIGDASIFTEYGISEKTFDGINGIPVLKMGDIQDGKVILGGQKLVPANIDGLPALYLKKWDLLYNRTNSAELVGKTGIYDGPDDAYTFASYLIRIRCSKKNVHPQYLNLCMNTVLFRITQIKPHLKQQCGQANVNGTIMRNMILPIPPIFEQHRIVDKVDELMTLCDALKDRLNKAGTIQVQLADVVVEKALNSA